MTLVKVGQAILASPAAASYARCLAAGAPGGVTSSYRDPNYQQYLYDGWKARKPGFNFALPPAKSEHVAGNALDLPAWCRDWFRKNGHEYGWFFTDKNEDWHIAYRPQYDAHIDDDKPRAVEQVPVKQPIRVSVEDTVKAIRSTNGRIALIGPGYFRHLEPAEWAAVQKVYWYTQITDAEYDVIERVLTPSV